MQHNKSTLLLIKGNKARYEASAGLFPRRLEIYVTMLIRLSYRSQT